MDVLCTVVPTGTGCAVFPTVNGMQPAVNVMDNAAAQRRGFKIMIRPRLEFGSNLGRAWVLVFTSGYVGLRRERSAHAVTDLNKERRGVLDPSRDAKATRS
jgi:hypothetical protein